LNDSKSILNLAKIVINKQSKAVVGLIPQLDSDFEKVIFWAHESLGRLILTGVGKSAIIGMKITATLNSTGTKSIFMHAADAIHGDLGMVDKNDIVICLSKSGNSTEIKTLVPIVKNRGNKLIGMTANPGSCLGKNSDALLHVDIACEADPNNLAPTSSTTAQMVMGDTLAICLMELNGFKAKDFAITHPGGALGKSLNIKLKNITQDFKRPVVSAESTISEIISEISSRLVGATVVMKKNKIIGIITDGDLRRMIENNNKLSSIVASNIMNNNPTILNSNTLAKKALDTMHKKQISQVIVVDKNYYVGIVHIHDILNEGIN
jgi:arabinose-5-phosphate isomerase